MKSDTQYSEHTYFWIDADAVFINFKRRLESFSEHANMLICKEGDGGTMGNTGAFFLKKSQWSMDFLHAWWHTGEEHPETLFSGRHEQQALDFLVHVNEWARSGVKFVPTSTFNTLPV